MKSLEDYIIAIDAKSASIVCYLRSVVLSCSKKIEETTFDNVPTYYYNNYKLCHLNITPSGVEMVFNYGAAFTDPFGILHKNKSGEFAINVIENVKEIDAYKIIAFVQQALLLNEIRQVTFQYAMRVLNK